MIVRNFRIKHSLTSGVFGECQIGSIDFFAFKLSSCKNSYEAIHLLILSHHIMSINMHLSNEFHNHIKTMKKYISLISTEKNTQKNL